MKKWALTIGGIAAVIALGFVLFQSLFGEDASQDVQPDVVPVVNKAKVNPKPVNTALVLNLNGGILDIFPDGLFHFTLLSTRNAESINHIPLALFKGVRPLVGQKIWVKIKINKETLEHKPTAVLLAAPTEAPKADEVYLFAQIKDYVFQPADKKDNLLVSYGEVIKDDKGNETIREFLNYKPTSKTLPIDTSPKQCVETNDQSDVCMPRLYNYLDAFVTVNEFGEVKITELKPNKDALPNVDHYPLFFK